jgi:hypothetical protein
MLKRGGILSDVVYLAGKKRKKKGEDMKKLSVLLIVFSLIFTASTFAGGKKGGWDLDQKFYKMSGMIVKNAEQLGMSEEQSETVRDNKYELKKHLIRTSAEIDLVCADISKELWKDKINVDEVNSLIDKKYQLKAGKMKAIVDAYGNLKNSLTEEQKAMLKDLWEAKCYGYCKEGKSKYGKKK